MTNLPQVFEYEGLTYAGMPEDFIIMQAQALKAEATIAVALALSRKDAVKCPHLRVLRPGMR